MSIKRMQLRSEAVYRKDSVHVLNRRRTVTIFNLLEKTQFCVIGTTITLITSVAMHVFETH
jgi:hypothetical protein